MKPNQSERIEQYQKEEKCPVTLHGKVIGWNITMVTYEKSKAVGIKFLSFISKNNQKSTKP